MDGPDPVGEPFDAIVLAGGEARRLGGVDKPGLEVAGISLLDRVLAACAGAESITVVGPPRAVSRPVVFTREDPPGGGPVPALAAGMEIGSSEVVAVFAADLPFLDRPAVELLRRSLTADAVVFTDARGKDQPLAAVYRRRALADALAAMSELSGARLFAILRTLTVTRVPDPHGVTADCDTWDALHTARALLATRPAAPTKMEDMDEKKLLADWCAAAAAELGLPAGHELTLADRDAILGLAGVAAHSVVRPAAPLTTFLAGYAVGLRSSDAGRVALDGPIAKLSALAQAWGQRSEEAGSGSGDAADAGSSASAGGSVAGKAGIGASASAGGSAAGSAGNGASASSNGSIGGDGPAAGSAANGGSTTGGESTSGPGDR